MNLQILQWIGYGASGIIALSMTLNSIVKFRWVNLLGAGTFALYGFLIGAYPVMALNSFIVSVDIYYLVRIYSKKNHFDTLEVRGDNKYLLKFLEYHNDDIQKYFSGFQYKPELNSISFFVLRNMAVSGVFLAHREGEDILSVGLDYVIPEYRDFKNGKYVFYHLSNRFKSEGFKKIIARGTSPKHVKYLKKQGFKPNNMGFFEKNID